MIYAYPMQNPPPLPQTAPAVPETPALAGVAAPAVAASLTAFIVVYIAIFSAGAYYVLRLMAKASHQTPGDEDQGPTRAAGITPAHALQPGTAFSGRSGGAQ